MASPSPITPNPNLPLSITHGSRVLKSPLTGDSISAKLGEAGFDADSIKRRDKASLIAYIAKLETEIVDTQHHMGLIILEKRELDSKYEQMKASAEAAELRCKCGQAAHLSALAEASKREENLKRALGVEKECIASIEKALHEMRAESAETKVAAETKLAEAYKIMEEAQKKTLDTEAKLHAAEVLQAEASRKHRSAERKLQEVEAREEDLSRHMDKLRSECEAKERDISLERQSLGERRKALQHEKETLIDSQALMNQREDIIASKSQELNRVEKDLESARANLDKEKRVLSDEKFKLELTLASLSQREEALIQREALLVKREQELLILQEKISSKEITEIRKALANHESVLITRKSEFESELELKRKLVEDEMDIKRRAWELREIDINQREDLVRETEKDLEAKSRRLTDKDRELIEKMNVLDEREGHLSAVQNDIELKRVLLQKEKEEIMKMKLDLQKSFDSMEDEKKLVYHAKENLETMKNKTDELSVLEMKLKEEVDLLRAQRLEFISEEDRLKVEKANFESEWESIDEKREQLQWEVELLIKEKEVVSELLKAERDSISLEKEAIRNQHKQDMELLNREREELMKKMVQERSELFSKMQKEHASFLLDLELQKRALESNIDKRHEKVESYLRDKEEAFEREQKNELEKIRALKEKAEEDLEQIALEKRRLDNERAEINLDRERRDKEWSVLNNLIEELKGQTQKLERQRELLHAERVEVCDQIKQTKKLEDLKFACHSKEVTCSNGGQTIKSLGSLEKQPGRYEFAEPMVILEVPAKSDMAKRIQDVDSEIMKDVGERMTCTIFDQSSQVRRKRSVDSCSEVHIDSLLEETKSNKKQKHNAADVSKDATNQRGSSTPESDVAEANGAGAEVQIIDKLIKITEVAREVTSTEILSSQEEPVQLKQSTEATVNHNMSNVSKDAHVYQLEDNIAKEGYPANPEVENSGAGRSHTVEKVIETIGMRTRSKQKNQDV